MTDERTRQFIATHRREDVRTLALHTTRHSDVDIPYALAQIAGWQTACQKLPSWAAIDDIVYPPHLSMEQCSSEHTARYKAALCRRLLSDSSHTTSLTDLTGGLGVDFSFMAQEFGHATYVEQQDTLCEMARHNLPLLGLGHATVIHADGVDTLANLSDVDLLFLDPARRDRHGARTFAIADCTPNILLIEAQLLAKARWVMLKLSPMLDWHKAMDDVQRDHPHTVREIHIVAVGNECKELLFVLSAKEAGSPTIHCVNDRQAFVTSVGEALTPPHLEGLRSIDDCQDMRYLYEPHAAMMKAGCFGALTSRWPVHPLAHNSHLFLSSDRIDDFPGRSFEIIHICTMNKKQLRSLTEETPQANITVRNFPLTAAELRRKLKIKDGGSHYLFASTTEDNTHVIFVCRKQ